MLKYTKASLNMLVDDCKRIAKIFKYVSLAFTILFLSYQIVNGAIQDQTLRIILNGALLGTFLISLVVEFLLDKKEYKSAKKIVKISYTWFKIAIKAATLVLTLIELVKASKPNGLEIVFASVMLMLWILSFVSQIILQIVSKRAEILIVAFKQDVDDIKRPFTAVSNTFKRLTGREVKQEDPNSRKARIIEKLDEEIRLKKIEEEDDDE